jgi:hypothetical protein
MGLFLRRRVLVSDFWAGLFAGYLDITSVSPSKNFYRRAPGLACNYHRLANLEPSPKKEEVKNEPALNPSGPREQFSSGNSEHKSTRHGRGHRPPPRRQAEFEMGKATASPPPKEHKVLVLPLSDYPPIAARTRPIARHPHPPASPPATTQCTFVMRERAPDFSALISGFKV